MVSKKNAAALRAGLCMGAFAVLAVAAGCGGGGGGGGGSEADAAPGQILENANYFPLQVGDRRAYRVTFSWGPFGESTDFFAQTVTGMRDVDGVPHFVVHEEGSDGGTDTLMTASAAAVHVRDADVTDRHANLLQFPATLGTAFTQDVGPYASDDVDGDGTPDMETARLVITPVDLSTVDTPAGHFERSLRVHYEVTTTIRRSSDGGTDTETSSYDTWYAPGVGRVRYASASGDSQAMMELVTWQPAAQPHHDTVAPTLLAVAPAPGTTTHAGGVLQLTFDETVSTSTVRDAVTVTNSLGERIDLSQEGPSDPTGRQLALVNLLGWSGGTYTVHIAAGITDLAGNAMAAQPDHTFVVDGAVPATTYTLPRAQVENVLGYDGVLTAYFSDGMDPASVGAIVLREGSVAVPATVTLQYGFMLTVTPATPLKPLTRYTVDLTGLKGLNGNAIANPVDWTFKTGATVTVGPLQGATTRPASVATLPRTLKSPRSAAVLRASRAR